MRLIRTNGVLPIPSRTVDIILFLLETVLKYNNYKVVFRSRITTIIWAYIIKIQNYYK